MKTKSGALIFLLAATLASAQTNNLAALLQQGLLEEQANRNLDAAIADYQSLAAQFDKDRQLAATAVFRLGECYRMQGKTNEAALEYRRILHDFSDQTTFATLSRQDLTGMGMAQPDNGKPTDHPGEATSEANSLASQISGIERLKSDLEEQARAVQAIFPDEDLKNMLLQLPKLQKQEADSKANPHLIDTYEKNGFNAFAAIGSTVMHYGNATNLLAEFQRQTLEQTAQIKQRVNFILGIQNARLKVLQSAGGFVVAPDAARNSAASVVIDEEAQEIQRVQTMIQNSPDLINVLSDGNTPLGNAAAHGWLKVVAFLLDHGADVNGGYGSALLSATKAGNRAMVELLLSRGANINANQQDIENTPLNIAVTKGFPAVVEVLLANKADVNAQTRSGNTPLLLAAQRSNPKNLTLLLEHQADVNAQSKDGSTPLTIAAHAGQLENVKLLLAAGANPNTEDNAGRTPLSFAADDNSPEMVKLLLTNKADPNGGKLDPPLLCSIHNNDAGSAELLLQAGAKPDKPGSVDWDVQKSGPTYSVPPTTSLTTLGALSVGSTLFASGHPSETPLFLAVSLNQLRMVELLLKFKADPNDSQTDGRPLAFGALSYTNILEALLDAGATANAHDRSTTINNVTIDQPLLNAAIARNNANIVGIILKYAADPNAAIATKTNSDIVGILLNHGADPNTPDNNGYTPLHLAAYFQSKNRIFELLFDHKANPNVRNDLGQTPLDILKQRLESSYPYYGNPDSAKARDKELAGVLRQHGALDNLPDWNRISVSRPAAGFSGPVFQRSTNAWNHFTLLEMIYQIYPTVTFSMFSQDAMSFPDLARVVVVRPSADGTAAKRIEVNLLNATNGVDCTRDLPLEFGDVVEIPEREHSLAEGTGYLTRDQEMGIQNYLRNRAGEAKLVVADHPPVSVPLLPGFLTIRNVLGYQIVQAALTSGSDLSRVTVTRRDPETGKTVEWSLDCSNKNGQGLPDFWMRNGDVIKVPVKP